MTGTNEMKQGNAIDEDEGWGVPSFKPCICGSLVTTLALSL